MSFFNDLKNKVLNKKDAKEYLSGFSKTSQNLNKHLRLFNFKNQDNDTLLEELMITLIEGDLGYKTSQKIIDNFARHLKKEKLDNEKFIDLLLNELKILYRYEDERPINYNQNGPTVMLIVGVNGAGKTSTIAKLANIYKKEGKKVCLVAADTFRAGAVEQLTKWADMLDIPIIKGRDKQDPSSVLVDGARFAKDNKIDILLCDTAGRLQNKQNLMNELNKMYKVLGKEIIEAPHNTWLVLDANTGQNAISQASLFNESAKLDGIILTKMDGTSKGGIVIALKDLLNIPVRYITFGEKIGDISKFDLDLYLYSLVEGKNNAG